MERKSLVGRVLIIGLLFSVFSFQVVALETRAAVEIRGDTAAASGRFSTGISEILKMIDAKVDLEIIKAYIKNSQIAYNLSPSEIIVLKDRGVSNEILALLIQHGGELRAQSPRFASQPAPNRVAPALAPAPYDYGASQPAPYPEYFPDYSYGYGGYPYAAAYPYSYSYYYNYPSWPYWSSFYCGFPFYYSSYYPFYRHHNFYGHYGYGRYGHYGYRGFGTHQGFNTHFGGHPWGTAGGGFSHHGFVNSGRTSFSPNFGGGFRGGSGFRGGFSGGTGFRGGGGGGHSGGGFRGHR